MSSHETVGILPWQRGKERSFGETRRSQSPVRSNGQGKKSISYNNTWGHFLFSFDNFQMCLDQIHQKDGLLFISALLAPSETGTSVTQLSVECRSIGLELNCSTWFPSPLIFCAHFHVTCKRAFRPDLRLWQRGPSRFLAVSLSHDLFFPFPPRKLG